MAVRMGVASRAVAATVAHRPSVMAVRCVSCVSAPSLAHADAPKSPWFKRSQRGLFAGKKRRTGNTVSFSQRKSRRAWLPNVQRKRLWSDTLNRMVPFKVTTSALRWIDKAGGLDNYLLNTKPHKLDSTVGMEYRAILEEIHAHHRAAAAAADAAAAAPEPAADAAGAQ